MASMTLQVLKQRKEERKNSNNSTSKKVENQVLIELRDMLEEYLAENEVVMIEVNERALGEFINVISSSILAVYEYEQIGKDKFIFKNKEIIF